MVAPGGIHKMAGRYLSGADAKHPYASPNLASLKGLPPLLIHVGRDEVLLDDSIKLDAKAKADGVRSTLEIWDDMIHVWHAFHPMLPESKRLRASAIHARAVGGCLTPRSGARSLLAATPALFL
jgi:acetyl esterase/lipase